VSSAAPRLDGPEDLPDFRLWLAQQWQPGAPIYEANARVQGFGATAEENPENYARWERETIRYADLWWVSPAMLDLTVAAMPSVPPDTRGRDLLLPSPRGLAVLEKPWVGHDAQSGAEIVVDVVVWGPSHLPQVRADQPPSGSPAMTIASYRTVDYDAGLSQGELAAATNLASPATRQDVRTRDGLGEVLAERDEHGNYRMLHLPGSSVIPGSVQEADVGFKKAVQLGLRGRYCLPLGRSDWLLQDEVGTSAWPTDSPLRSSSIAEDHRFLTAFSVLVAQPLAAVDTHRPPRHVRRRTERAMRRWGAVDPNTSDVRLVHLRRPRQKAGQPHEGDRSFSVQWMVQGHLRWQACGPGRKERRLTYVRPHIKGPEGAPMKNPDVVNVWDR